MIQYLGVFQTVLFGMASTVHFGGDVEDSRRIEGGEVTKTCVSPSTVSTLLKSMGGSGTGSLVHPKVVVFSAHSNSNSSIDYVYFGEDSAGEAGKKVEISRCINHPDWTGSNIEDGVDIGYCLLKEAITDVPIVPILMGCEVDQYIKPGMKVHQVGFGMSTPNQAPDGKKRWLANGSIEEMSENMTKASNPLGTGPLIGDSGGPLYIQLEDGTWRNAGVLSFGGGEEEKKITNYISIFRYVEWIEDELKDENIDITPCHDADGTWNPTELCKAFPMEPFKGGGSWENGCETGKLSGYSSTCGPPFDDSETTTTEGTSSETDSTDSETTDGTSSTDGTDGTDSETTDGTSSTDGTGTTDDATTNSSSDDTSSSESASTGSSSDGDESDEGESGTTGTEGEDGDETTTSSATSSTSSTSGSDTSGENSENTDAAESDEADSESTAGTNPEPDSGCHIAAPRHAFLWSSIGLILIGFFRRR